jgi:hypothetical protein
MTAAKALLVAAVGLLADTSFTSTINLGAILVGLLIIIGFAWASRKDKRSERWESLYNLADAERKEIRDKLVESDLKVTQLTALVAKLDALQMPIRIVELMNESVIRIDDAARGRLEHALDEMKGHFDNLDENAEERSKQVMEVLEDLVKRLPPVITGGL